MYRRRRALSILRFRDPLGFRRIASLWCWHLRKRGHAASSIPPLQRQGGCLDRCCGAAAALLGAQLRLTIRSSNAGVGAVWRWAASSGFAPGVAVLV
eukprot:15470016-Alexandrium_andersonii.AAC.1